jgi:hypothetical protein
VFEPSKVSATLRSEQARMFPFVLGPQGEPFGRNFTGPPAVFDASVYGPNGLVACVANRAVRVQQILRAAN